MPGHPGRPGAAAGADDEIPGGRGRTMTDQAHEVERARTAPTHAHERQAEQVGGLDAMFLNCETPTMHMHVCGLLILDPSVTGVADPYGAIRKMLESAPPGISPMRRRLVTVPLNLGRPYWTDEATIDLDRHLRRVTVDPPGDDRALGALAGSFASTPLRRDRPLWEMLFVEGLAGGKVALLAKMHHSSIDGVSGANLLGSLFDLTPEGQTLELARAPRPTVVPRPLEMTRRAILERLSDPVEIAKLIPSTIASVVSGAWRMATRREGKGPMAIPFSAPRTSFNATLTAERSVAFADVSLSRVKEVRRRLRRHRQRRHHGPGGRCAPPLPGRAGRAARAPPAGRRAGLGPRADRRAWPATPRCRSCSATLATDIDDPSLRLQVIAEANRRAKELQSMVGADTLMQLAEHFWLNGVALGARLYSSLNLADHHPVVHNLILSNVPGPPVPLYLAGTQLVGVYPLGPLMDGAGLNVTALSEENRIGFGFMACPALVPDVWSVAAGDPRRPRRARRGPARPPERSSQAVPTRESVTAASISVRTDLEKKKPTWPPW